MVATPCTGWTCVRRPVSAHGRLRGVPLRGHRRPGIVLLSRPIRGSLSEQGSHLPYTPRDRLRQHSSCETGTRTTQRDIGSPPFSPGRVTWEHRGRPRHVSKGTLLRRRVAISFALPADSQTHCPLLRLACRFPKTARNRISRRRCPVFENRPWPLAVCAHGKRSVTTTESV